MSVEKAAGISMMPVSSVKHLYRQSIADVRKFVRLFVDMVALATVTISSVGASVDAAPVRGASDPANSLG